MAVKGWMRAGFLATATFALGSNQVWTNVCHSRPQQHYNLLCDPSQKGAFPVCLQPHQAIFLASSTFSIQGLKGVGRCEPSQKGCLPDNPQAHQAYVPGSTFMTNGFLAGIFGFSIVTDNVICCFRALILVYYCDLQQGSLLYRFAISPFYSTDCYVDLPYRRLYHRNLTEPLMK